MEQTLIERYRADAAALRRDIEMTAARDRARAIAGGLRYLSSRLHELVSHVAASMTAAARPAASDRSTQDAQHRRGLRGFDPRPV